MNNLNRCIELLVGVQSFLSVITVRLSFFDLALRHLTVLLYEFLEPLVKILRILDFLFNPVLLLSFTGFFFMVIKDPLRISFSYRRWLHRCRSISLTIDRRLCWVCTPCGSTSVCLIAVSTLGLGCCNTLVCITSLVSLDEQSALKVLVLKASPAWLLWLSVKLYRLATGGTLNLLDEPLTKADQVEHMAAAQLLAFLNVAKTDATLVSLSSILLCSFHVLELFEFLDELTPFDERNALVAKRAQVVRNLTEYVDGESAPAHDDKKEA